jgi:hypothetical protein
MSRIAVDSRHRNVTLLSAGWVPERRYAGWPMLLTENLPSPISVARAGSGSPWSPCDLDRAQVAFDKLAEEHRHRRERESLKPLIEDFASSLIQSPSDTLPDLPSEARRSLRARADVVDCTCALFADGWQKDIWCGAEIAIGLAHLNCLWQRAGRIREPECERGRVAVAVPPGSHEILGAIVKADLLRSAGFSVRMVLEKDTEAYLRALSESGISPIIVAGPRVGLYGDEERAQRFAEMLQARCPDQSVHLSSRSGAPLDDWPARLAFRHHQARGLSAVAVEWLGLAALSTLAQRSLPRTR